MRSPQVRHWLENVTVYDGPPAEMASLVPDNEGRAKDKALWTFSKRKERPIWIACSYLKTDLLYAKALPLDTTYCQVAESKSKPPSIVGVICR